MVYRRERPKIRKLLQELMDEYGWDARELYEFTSFEYDDDFEYIHLFSLSSGMRVQLRKMIEEYQGGVLTNDET